jgi:hypothetical protein
MFPLAFRVAMAVLAIQASAVSCEHLFSSAAHTDTEDHNRMSPDLLQALQVLKFTYRQQRGEVLLVEGLVFEEMDIATAESDLSSCLQNTQCFVRVLSGRQRQSS